MTVDNDSTCTSQATILAKFEIHRYSLYRQEGIPQFTDEKKLGYRNSTNSRPSIWKRLQ